MKLISFLYPYPIRNIEAPHLWSLYKLLENIPASDIHCIGSEDYFKGADYFKTQKRWECNWAKKGWLTELYNAPQDVQDLKICGEDMSFSFMLLKNKNIKTFVPPHPAKNQNFELYGSIPSIGLSIGSDKSSLSQNNSNLKAYNQSMNILLGRHWKTVFKRNKISFFICKFIQIMCDLVKNKKKKSKIKNYLIQKVLYVQ